MSQFEYEYVDLVIPRDVSRTGVVRLLTDHAEYGRWELARLRIHAGGERRIRLKRRALRMRRTA